MVSQSLYEAMPTFLIALAVVCILTPGASAVATDPEWTRSYSNEILRQMRSSLKDQENHQKGRRQEAGSAASSNEAGLARLGLPISAAHSMSGGFLSTWMMFEVDHTGHIELVAARGTNQSHSPCKAFPTDPADIDGHVVVSFQVDGDTHSHKPFSSHRSAVGLGSWCHVPHPDPRKLFHDTQHPTKRGKWHGGLHHHERSHFAVNVPRTVKQIETVDLKHGFQSQKRHFVTEEHHRNFQTLQTTVTVDASQIVSEPLQVVGPVDEQKNLVFVSSGYTGGDKAKFDADVQSILALLQLPDPDRQLSSQPYQRYFSTMNFFQVWHPSNEGGASHPSPAGDGTTVDNNLGCSYGADSARILTCSRAKVHIVASYAPPDPTTSLTIVLVNDNLFGGTGGSGVCSVYNGAKVNVVLIHEIGHASSALADEYDYGSAEGRQVNLGNCHWSQNEPPWNAWILSGILPRPTPVCTYSNYYKPTPGACLMESDQPSLCPVCAGIVLKDFYSNGMNLAAPRFPSPHEVMYIKDGDVGYLYANTRVPYHKDETGTFTTSWVDPAGAVIARSTHLIALVPKGGSGANGTTSYAYGGAGDLFIEYHVQDNTNMFLAAERAAQSSGANYTSMKQIHRYRITVYAAGSAAPNCTTRSTPYSTQYCGLCDAGKESACSLTLTSRPLQSAVDVGGKLAGLETWLLGVGGAFVLLGLISFFLIWKTMSLHAETTVGEICPLSPCVAASRIALMIMQMVLLIGSTLCIIFSAYMYTVLSVFGRTIVLGIIAVSAVVWFSSFVGFCASYYKNRAVLFFNFVLLLLLFGCALLFTCMLLYVLFNIDTEGVRSQLHAEWQASVADDARTVCTLQSVLECSGFNTSCITVNTPAGTSDCPANCEIGNQVGFPCFLRIRAFVKEKFGIMSIGGGVLTVIIFVTMVLAIVVGCSIKTNKQRVTRLRHERAKRGEAALSPEEEEMLHEEFKKIDVDGSGDISREEFSSFYNSVMGANLNARQLEEYFDKLDSDQSGTLSFEEFIKVYKPQKKQRKRTLAEARAQFEGTTDLNGTVADDEDDEGADQAVLGASRGPSSPNSARSQRRENRMADIELDLCVEEDDEDIAVAPKTANDTFNASMGNRTLDVDGMDVMNNGIDLDDDDDMGGPSEAQLQSTIAAQEARAQEEALATAKAHADRQKRLAMDRPTNLDMELVMDDINVDDIGGIDVDGGNLDDFEAMDLEINLDDETY